MIHKRWLGGFCTFNKVCLREMLKITQDSARSLLSICRVVFHDSI